VRDEKIYFAYIMTSMSGGVTGSAKRRSSEHKLGSGSVFTARYDVNRLVYYESFRYIGNAIARETEIKGWRGQRRSH
jgi:putative endonuclease